LVPVDTESDKTEYLDDIKFIDNIHGM